MMPGQEVQALVESLKEAVAVLHDNTKGSKKEFVGNEEFMELMGISKRTAQTWRDEGIIAFSQVGSKIYYSMADIAKLMQEHRRGQFNETNKNRRSL